MSPFCIPARQMAVADDLTMSLGIDAVPALFDPFGDLRLDGLREEFLGPSPENFRQQVGRTGQWYNANLFRTVNHGGVLPGLVGRLVKLDTSRVRRLSLSRYPQHSIIPHLPGGLGGIALDVPNAAQPHPKSKKCA
jgi:hypothetical protein